MVGSLALAEATSAKTAMSVAHARYARRMSTDSGDIIGPDDVAYRLELTPAQLKVTYTALRIFFDDLGHDEHDVKVAVRSVLDKLPSEHDIRSIEIPSVRDQ